MKVLIRSIPALVALLCAAVSLSAQPFLVNCVVVADPPLLRAEGVAERIGDIQFNCAGGDPNQVIFLNFVLILNTNITSDLTGPGQDELEAMLLIDDPNPGVVNVSNSVTYEGQVKGTPGVGPGPAGGPGAEGSGNVYTATRMPGFDNRIQWNGVPFVPPGVGKGRIIRFVNVRADMTSFFATAENPASVLTTLAMSPPNTLLVGTPTVVAGHATPSMVTSVRREMDRFEMTFQEVYPTAFRKRIENTVAGDFTAKLQALPAAGYFTESGFTPEYGGLDAAAAGVADSGTRLIAHFNGLPHGVAMTAPSTVIGFGAGQETPSGIEARRVLEFDPDYSGGLLQNRDAPTELVPVANGQATLVYEIVAAAPYEGVNGGAVLDQFRIPARLVFGQPTNLGAPTVTLSLGPADETRVTSAAAPEPRFFPPIGNDVVFPVSGGYTLDYLTFKYTPSDAVPVERVVEFEPESPGISDTLVTSTDSGGPWLSATPATAGTTPSITIALNPVGLAPGVYYGFVAIRQEAAPDDIRVIPVMLQVTPPPEMVVDTSPVLFRVQAGAPAPEPLIRLVVARNKNLNWETSTATSSGGEWLSATPAAARTPANLKIAANPTGLAPGTYEGGVSLRSSTAANAPALIPVTLEVLSSVPQFTAAGVVNAASYQGNAVAPGELVTIFGTNIGPAVPAGARLDENGHVATLVSGTRFLFDGIAAPVIAVSRLQSTCVVPFAAGLKRSVMLEVEVDGQRSGPVQIQVTQAVPGIFTAAMSGAGQGAILNQDGTVNSPANPAARGSVVMIYLTGAGATVPAGIDGTVNNPTDPPRILQTVSVKIGGVDAGTEFAGGAPGSVAGAVQVNARIDLSVAPGPAVPIEVTVGQATSQTGVTVAVE